MSTQEGLSKARPAGPGQQEDDVDVTDTMNDTMGDTILADDSDDVRDRESVWIEPGRHSDRDGRARGRRTGASTPGGERASASPRHS